MPNLVRVRTEWNGSPVVGPGVSTFYFAEAHTGFVADVAAFFAALITLVPTGVTFTTQNTGDLIDVATGELSGTWTDGTTATAISSGSGAYALGVGARVRWATSGIRNGRRVRGSTFIVPLIAGAYDTAGTLSTPTLNTISTAANALFTGSTPEQRVYSRPAPGLAGQSNTVVGLTVPDKVSWLRSRRT